MLESRHHCSACGQRYLGGAEAERGNCELCGTQGTVEALEDTGAAHNVWIAGASGELATAPTTPARSAKQTIREGADIDPRRSGRWSRHRKSVLSPAAVITWIVQIAAAILVFWGIRWLIGIPDDGKVKSHWVSCGQCKRPELRGGVLGRRWERVPMTWGFADSATAVAFAEVHARGGHPVLLNGQFVRPRAIPLLLAPEVGGAAPGILKDSSVAPAVLIDSFSKERSPPPSDFVRELREALSRATATSRATE